jgi:hypothetical protein
MPDDLAVPAEELLAGGFAVGGRAERFWGGWVQVEHSTNYQMVRPRIGVKLEALLGKPAVAHETATTT